MAIEKQNSLVGAAARVLGVLGFFVLAAMGQQKNGNIASGAASQANANMAQQSLLMAQTASTIPTSRSGQGSGAASLSQDDDSLLHLQDRARLKGNDERQKRLENDAKRLLALANLLKIEVAASGSETMTPEMLRQMDEIEKLARSVKDRMRS